MVIVDYGDLLRPSTSYREKRMELESKNIADINYLKKYGVTVKKHISDFNNQIKELSKDYKIAGYGASGRAGIFCSMTGLDENIVKFIVDESPERCGRYLSGTKIPIVEQSELQDTDVNLLIIFAWNYSKMIIDKTFWGFFKYLVAFPTVKLVNNYDELDGFDSI